MPAPRPRRTPRALAAALGLGLVSVGLPVVTAAPSQAADSSACPAPLVTAGQFPDVAPTSVHAASIDCVAWWGITGGRVDGTFGGSGDVTRGQLATFLARMLALAGRLPTTAPDAFADDDGSVHQPALRSLASLGIMAGTSPGVSGHGLPVTRAQSASLVARTLGWLDGTPLPPGPDAFSDDSGSPHEEATNALAALGIVQGTSPTTFGHDRHLTRAQMASILVRSASYLLDRGHVVVPTAATPVQVIPLDRSISVRWAATAVPHRWKVLAFADGRYVGQRTFGGSARGGRIDHLPPGTTIVTWLVPLDANGGWGSWLTSAPVQLLPDASCQRSAPGTCVHVDAGAPAGVATGVGLGFLHGATIETDPARVAALEPRHWRVSARDPERFGLARASGASVTVLVSDPWAWQTGQSDGTVASPWSDWAAYEAFVVRVAQWHVANEKVPDQWEVQNEPSVGLYRGGAPATTALLVEQHARAAAAIRSVVPGADVVGPAVSPPLFGHGLNDLQAFTAEVAARGLELNALTWHENIGYCATCDGGPAAARQHIDEARAALRAAGLTGMPIDITEHGHPYEQLQPGAIVGYLGAFTDGGVRYANTTCWERPGAGGQIENSCFARPGTLDSLLLTDGTTPTDAWWTYRAYAALAGDGARLAATTVDSPTASAVASVTGTSTVQALVGRHVGCTAADAPCPGGTPAGAPEPVTVRLSVPTAGTWTVVVSRIASTAGGAGPPAEVHRATALAGAGPLTVGTFSVADGEVLQVIATRA